MRMGLFGRQKGKYTIPVYEAKKAQEVLASMRPSDPEDATVTGTEDAK